MNAVEALTCIGATAVAGTAAATAVLERSAKFGKIAFLCLKASAVVLIVFMLSTPVICLVFAGLDTVF